MSYRLEKFEWCYLTRTVFLTGWIWLTFSPNVFAQPIDGDSQLPPLPDFLPADSLPTENDRVLPVVRFVENPGSTFNVTAFEFRGSNLISTDTLKEITSSYIGESVSLGN